MHTPIELENLTKRYADRAVVQSLSLVVEAGTIMGLLGPNGAGKTTTLAMLLHLVCPTSGRVLVGGVDVWHAPAQALRSVGALIETPAFYPYLSAYDNLLLLGRHAQIDPATLPMLLASVGLDSRMHERVRTYSQGMRQRLGIAAALLHDPAILILDEPTVGLDPRGVVWLRDLLHTRATNGGTIIFSSHQLAEVQQICDHVAILDAGRLIASGSVADLLGTGGRVLIAIRGDALMCDRALALVRAWNGGTKARLLDDTIDALVAADRTADLNRMLVQHDIAVAELHSVAPSLEDVFLNLTDKGSAQ